MTTLPITLEFQVRMLPFAPRPGVAFRKDTFVYQIWERETPWIFEWWSMVEYWIFIQPWIGGMGKSASMEPWIGVWSIAARSGGLSPIPCPAKLLRDKPPAPAGIRGNDPPDNGDIRLIDKPTAICDNGFHDMWQYKSSWIGT
jgi:hypothetical protein